MTDLEQVSYPNQDTGSLSPEHSVESLTHNPNEEASSSEDDYILSDDEDLSQILSHDNMPNPHLPGSGSMVDHAKYFSDTLSHALDSVDIDKSLNCKVERRI
ncbi:hypothetical protein G210_2534 [Candida maltosa Xu316]|uniref:Uncharacterized protein n=1 Tax=Candida maltosa (strain Xu316) TaxID=1245528 RepID=M3HIK1_CANMX|nr:hypothetical protein G210_2534 [Candida maltosa Xu316]